MAQKKAKKPNTIKITLKGYDHRKLDFAVNSIVDVVNRTGAKVLGPVPIPTKIDRITVNRSPHIDKKSREQFEIRTSSRLLYIVQPGSPTIEALRNFDLSPGIEVEIKVLGDLQ